MTDAKARLLQMIADEPHMGGGGLLKAVGKAQKVAKAAKTAETGMKAILPTVEREANLAKMLEGSKVKERLYHGTKGNINKFDKSRTGKGSTMFGDYDVERHGIFMTPETKLANEFASQGQNHTGANVMPLYASLKNPLDMTGGYNDELFNKVSDWGDKQGLNGYRVARHLGDNWGDWQLFDKDAGQDPEFFINMLKELGYDSAKIHEPPVAGEGASGLTYVAFEPTQIKSAIGNQGTYDLTDFDINKAGGGAVNMAGGGRTPKYPWERYEQPKKVAEMRARQISPIAGAVKKGADYATQLIDKGPSFSNLVGGLVGAVPFIGPDMRKRMEASDIAIPTDFTLGSNMPSEDYEYGQPMQYRKPGISTTSVPTKDVLEALNVSDLVGAPGLSKVAEDIGYGQMPDALDLLDAAGVGALGYGAVKAGVKGAGAANKATQALTSSKITPLETGATYATKQEGPFLRISPAALGEGNLSTRGVREADGIPSSTVDGGGASPTGQRLPKQFSSEEVAGLIQNPNNKALKLAQSYTKERRGSDFAVPQMPESSLAKQSAIGRTHMAAVEGSPSYKRAIFDAYAKTMPDVLEQAGAKNYDDLMEKAYRQLAVETSEQFDRLPISMSFHRSGEGNYRGAKEMASDVHGNDHMYVFQGGDPHDFLNRVDPRTGLNENEKFRAVHDFFGHAILGNEFGPMGEEKAWSIHNQMYSPLAQMAMTAETRGQNSVVNYTPLNAKLKSEIAKLRSVQMDSKRRGDVQGVEAAEKSIQNAFQGFQYAPQKAILLPPEYLRPDYAGGMPDYVRKLIVPEKGTSIQSALTHYSNVPDLQFTDPARYGTGIKGAEAERLAEPGAVRDRSYFYMGEPGAISPEPGLGVNRYRGESSNLYDITQDPLNFNVLARESNRAPYSAKYNQGINYPTQDANDIERLIREYGYEGMANPKASKPMAIMFNKTPVQRRKKGGEVCMAAGGAVSDAKQRLLDMIAEEPHMGSGGEVHMGKGGIPNKLKKLADAAKAAKKKVKVEHPLLFPRAAAKTLEDIRPIAQRMAEQVTGEFVKQNPKVTTNPAGKSRKQFERERSIPLETRNVVPERPAPDVNYEDYKGYGLVGVPGDPTMGGVAKRGSLEEVARPTVELTRVGDITPDYPVPLFGGPRYGDEDKFWASNLAAAVPVQNSANELAKLYESPVLGKYLKMSEGSENFALHNLDALLSIQRPEQLSKTKMAELTNRIRAGSPDYGKFPGFTGFKDPADVLLQAQMDSKLRKHIAETLLKPTITQPLGLPNGLDVVAAITYPELRNLEAGASGFSVGKMKPGATLQRGESSHPTYDTDIPGSFLGRSRYPTPYEIAFPDTTAYARSKLTPGVNEFSMMKMLGPRERIDQQYIDEMKMYEQLMKQYTGKKKGGLAQTKKVKRHGDTVSN